jgi:hypothetical protein
MIKIAKILTKIKNLFSKHRAASLTATVGALLLIASIAILIGGSALGWDFAGFFTSPTFILVITIAILILFACVYYVIVGRRNRW